MNKPRLHLLAALIALVLAGLACNFGASTANIPNAWTAYDKEGAQPSTVFAQDDVIHLIVELANAPDDTVVKASWTAVALTWGSRPAANRNCSPSWPWRIQTR